MMPSHPSYIDDLMLSRVVAQYYTFISRPLLIQPHRSCFRQTDEETDFGFSKSLSRWSVFCKA